MNGPQDLGGKPGYGAVMPEPEDVLFHADWEKRALALTLACGALGHWTLDESRHARECLPEEIYLHTSYYEIWIRALESLLLKHGEVSAAELASGRMAYPGHRSERCLPAERVAPMIAAGGPTTRPPRSPARYQVGDRVRTRNHQPKGHTRLPAYAREKPATIAAVRGAHVFADTNAHGLGEQPEWLYTLVLKATDLWGDEGRAGDTVTIDAWEPYIVPA